MPSTSDIPKPNKGDEEDQDEDFHKMTSINRLWVGGIVQRRARPISLALIRLGNAVRSSPYNDTALWREQRNALLHIDGLPLHLGAGDTYRPPRFASLEDKARDYASPNGRSRGDAC